MADFSAESILEYEEIVRKLFASEDEAFEFYNKYAFDKGFSVRKSYVEWDDAKTEIVLRKFVCSRRWTRNAKCAFPPIRKSNIYDYSKSLVRYRDLRNLSHAASFRAAQSSESYQRLKRVLLDETDSKSPCASGNERIRYGPMVAQALEVDCGKVLDPMHVPGRGAPKKKLKALNKKERAKVTCTLCKDVGHNRRTCSKRKEETMLPEDFDA